MRQLRHNPFIAALLLFSTLACAKSGLLFQIRETGAASSADIILCLNGKGPLSCQNYHVSAENLAITSTVQHQYPAAGIAVLTPGFNLSGCTPYPNGYCLFPVNSQTPTYLLLQSNTAAYSVGGNISGLVGSVSLQNNGSDLLTQSSNGTFTFPTKVTQGAAYNVTVSIQPPTQTCTVMNGSGIMGRANVTNVTISCTSNTTTLSVTPDHAVIPLGGFETLTIENTGTAYAANNVSVALPSTMGDVNQTRIGCDSIPPNGGTCTIFLSSITPYVAAGNIPVVADNVPSPPRMALAFSIKEDPAAIESYLIWEVNPITRNVQVIDTENLPSSPWGSNTITTNAVDFYNGDANTDDINSFASTIGTSAAVNCYNSTRGGAAIGTWYLPAICQLSGTGQNAGCLPGFANIDTNLQNLGFGNLMSSPARYWSSTEDNMGSAWAQDLGPEGSPSQQYSVDKATTYFVRCAREISY